MNVTAGKPAGVLILGDRIRILKRGQLRIYSFIRLFAQLILSENLKTINCPKDIDHPGREVGAGAGVVPSWPGVKVYG